MIKALPMSLLRGNGLVISPFRVRGYRSDRGQVSILMGRNFIKPIIALKIEEMPFFARR